MTGPVAWRYKLRDVDPNSCAEAWHVTQFDPNVDRFRDPSRWLIEPLYLRGESKCAALAARVEALEQAATKLLVTLNHAACWCESCRSLRNTLLGYPA